MMKGGIAGLMKQAQQMQERMAKAQAELANIEVEGQSGAGMVKVTMTCKHDVRCVVIDPRRTETAERAHLLVQPRPGTDGALALGLAHLIIGQGLADPEFIRDHVLGYEAFARSVAAWTPERTAAVTGVPSRLH